jgi:hypothetical protein
LRTPSNTPLHLLTLSAFNQLMQISAFYRHVRSSPCTDLIIGYIFSISNPDLLDLSLTTFRLLLENCSAGEKEDVGVRVAEGVGVKLKESRSSEIILKGLKILGVATD